jgi:hypothetical protein
MLERLARDKHSSLLQTLVNYVRKKFYNIGPRSDTSSESATSWKTICVTNDVTGGNVKLWVDGQVRLNVASKVKPTFGNFLSLGSCRNLSMVGLISDVNVWSWPLGEQGPMLQNFLQS